MPIRPNSYKNALARNDLQIGTWVMMLRNPEAFALLDRCGIHMARLDMEHTPISIETVADIAVVARALGISLSVRLPNGSREWVARALDAGVWNIVIPLVDTVEYARSIVEVARHAPAGSRGTFEPGPQNDYTPAEEMDDELGSMNAGVHITILLETRKAFSNMEALLAVPGINAYGTGPADLAQDLGIYGSPSHGPTTLEHELSLLEAANRHGKTAETCAWSQRELDEKIAAGYRSVIYQTDTGILREECGAALDAVRRGFARTV